AAGSAGAVLGGVAGWGGAGRAAPDVTGGGAADVARGGAADVARGGAADVAGRRAADVAGGAATDQEVGLVGGERGGELLAERRRRRLPCQLGSGRRGGEGDDRGQQGALPGGQVEPVQGGGKRVESVLADLRLGHRGPPAGTG